MDHAIASPAAQRDERLRAVAERHGAPLPGGLDEPTRRQIGEMQTFTGPAFDRYFLAFQEETHLRALKQFDAQASYGGDEGLHHYAETMLAMLNATLREVVNLTDAVAREQTDIPAHPDPQSAEQSPR